MTISESDIAEVTEMVRYPDKWIREFAKAARKYPIHEKQEAMTFQEIHERICVHRSNLISTSDGAMIINVNEILRKINEIEWALQALAEKLAQEETP